MEYSARESARAAVMPCFEKLCELYAEKPRTLDRVLVLDTETTGLDPERNEMLQLSIIDGNGTTLYNSYFHPCADTWTDAERVNGISPEDVQTAPQLSEELPKIAAILARAYLIIGYNLPFDMGFLRCSGVPVPAAAALHDVMLMFAPVYGEYSEYYEGYKWQKLTRAAAYYGYDWTEHGSAHNSLADCYATLFVYNSLADDTETDDGGTLEEAADLPLTPSPNGRDCLGNGEHNGIEIQCDECSHFYECFPEDKELRT
jgi:DNA polymerase-3 subunit epsilon